MEGLHWSAQSSDLNATSKHLKKIGATIEGEAKQTEVFTMLMQRWKQIGTDNKRKLAEGVPRRMNAVTAATYDIHHTRFSKKITYGVGCALLFVSSGAPRMWKLSRMWWTISLKDVLLQGVSNICFQN